MWKFIRSTVLVMAAAGWLFGCASPEVAYTPDPFTPARIDTTGFVQKINTFSVLLDASSSMNGKYQNKFRYAKEITSRLNRTVPAGNYRAALVAFGYGSCTKNQEAWVAYGPAGFNTADFQAGLDAVKCSAGYTPMEVGIDAARASLAGDPGRIAVFIVSDFKKLHAGSPDANAVKAATERLKSEFGSRLCVYPIQIGNDPAGATLAGELGDIGGCGKAVNADSIASANAMAAYLKDAFLEPAPPPPPAPRVADSDGDGVPDNMDQCPNTPKGARVTRTGCWVLAGENVLFDTSKATIKDYSVLDAAAEILRRNPDLTGEIRGHTDSTGPREFNMTLSVKRATAVRDYFVSQGIAANRLRVTGVGPDEPVASNDTAEGRRLNRRVELRAD
jgi:OOP family OmpA-OmpF porin